MVTKVIGDWSEEMLLKALITDPTFIGEIGIGGVNVSETELGLLSGAIEGANKLQIGDILIQWGNETSGFSGGEKIVTFPVAYTSTPFVMMTHSNHATASTLALAAGASVITTTAVTIQNRGISDSGVGETDVADTTWDVSWIAIGINTA